MTEEQNKNQSQKRAETRLALITGASGGIGKTVAIGLAGLGYQLAITGRKEADLRSTASKIKNNGGLPPAVFNLDITNEEQLRTMIAQLKNDFGRIDILVNNAGIHFCGTTELPADDFRLMLETNLTAQFMVLKHVVPIMKEQKSGYIFNVASRSGKTGFAGTGGYCASKFGLVGLNESLYRELTPAGIKVTALCPAWVNTAMADKAGTELAPDERIQPADLFETIRWLLSLSPGACVREVVITNPLSL